MDNDKRDMPLIDYYTSFKNNITTCYRSSNKDTLKLVIGKKRSNGRNNRGIITLRSRGGGHKKKYRWIDFKRSESHLNAKVQRVEYDPNRNAKIAILYYSSENLQQYEYILAPRSLQRGEKLASGRNAALRVGNAKPLMFIPLGSIIHNIELNIGKGGQIARAAGVFAKLIAKDKKHAMIRLPSNEIRLVSNKCYATLGQVGLSKSGRRKNLRKAGKTRWLGKRPYVRGIAKNPNDHPHGGGEGRSPIGRPAPITPWGKVALGSKTRHNSKKNDTYILRARKS